MGLWLLRVWIALIGCYVGYIVVVAAIHTVCDCLR